MRRCAPLVSSSTCYLSSVVSLNCVAACTRLLGSVSDDDGIKLDPNTAGHQQHSFEATSRTFDQLLSNRQRHLFPLLVGKLAFYATPPYSPPAHRISPLDTLRGATEGYQYSGMDGDGHPSRQSDSSSYTTPRSIGQPSLRHPGSSASDRFRPTSIVSSQTPTLNPATGERAGNPSGYSGYGAYGGYGEQSQYTPQSMQYQPELQQDTQRQQQQQQQFSPYGPGMMYNVAQQTQQQSPYQPAQQYQPRQSAAIEVLSTQFGVPQYFPSGESSAAGVAAVPQQYPTSQFQPTSFPQQGTLGRSSLPQSYATGMAEYSQMSGSEVLEQQEYGQEGTNYDNAYNQFQDALRQTFDSIKASRLSEASQSLLQISEWLLSNALNLGKVSTFSFHVSDMEANADKGLVRDEKDLHDDRIKLWNEFNTCWLALLQKQKDLTTQMQESGQQPQPPQTVIPADYLRKMAKELVRMCDDMERHGMVDYQMGVWEEDIMNVLLECLDVLEGREGNRAPVAGSSRSAV
ncbi:MAG: hypothetical protein M1834_000314 [Cirrosporium novae-zelandiae]|nr:MAG: hypothetical protein M1834_000314 [Cirrosporium novae-zelandiae]